jgi:prepilin-type N-terminal cleavage/methylation domain-containing protein
MSRTFEFKIGNSRGFTFIELLIVMMLVGIMSVFLASIYRGTVVLFRDQNLEISVIESANVLNKFLLENLRLAEGVEDTITDGGDTFVSGSDELILRVPALDGSGDPVPGVYDHYVFYQDPLSSSDFRWRLVPNGASSRNPFDHLAAEEIISLQITYDELFPEDANLVTVTYTLEKSNVFGSKSITRSTSINMRNQ